MIVTRWKVMVGAVGVSLGGLAAIAGQCPKDIHLTNRADKPLVAEAPKPPSGGSAAADKPTTPPHELPTPVDPLTLPVIPASAPALPAPPPPMPSKPADLPPALPVFKAPELKVPDVAASPVIPVSAELPVLPAVPADKPKAIPAAPALDLPAAPVTKPATPPAPIKATAVEPTPIEFSAPPALPVTPSPAPIKAAPPVAAPIVDAAPATKPVIAASAVVPSEAKYRIVLRVGEGEPSFEVRSGDDLIMKVKSEKVDIKSPEKGSGLSAVTATGKVRFVGFGAEGTCESLSFLAGTGEVAMTGAVKVQVKDKIGRVESELTADKMQYKLDSTALPGMLKP